MNSTSSSSSNSQSSSTNAITRIFEHYNIIQHHHHRNNNHRQPNQSNSQHSTIIINGDNGNTQNFQNGNGNAITIPTSATTRIIQINPTHHHHHHSTPSSSSSRNIVTIEPVYAATIRRVSIQSTPSSTSSNEEINNRNQEQQQQQQEQRLESSTQPNTSSSITSTTNTATDTLNHGQQTTNNGHQSSIITGLISDDNNDNLMDSSSSSSSTNEQQSISNENVNQQQQQQQSGESTTSRNRSPFSVTMNLTFNIHQHSGSNHHHHQQQQQQQQQPRNFNNLFEVPINGGVGAEWILDANLLRTRQRVYSVGIVLFSIMIKMLLIRIALLYSVSIPKFIRNIFEYSILLMAFISFALLIHMHVMFIRSPLTCLDHVKQTWPKHGILRVQIDSGSSYLKLKPKVSENFNNQYSPLNPVIINMENDIDENDPELTFLNYKKNGAWSEPYIVEYSLEYGLLRLSEQMRDRYHVPVMKVVLNPETDKCFGDRTARFMLNNFLGYDDVLIGSIKQLAERENNRGFVRNVVTGEHFRFVNVWMTRTSYLAAAFIMIVFTLFVSMLIRYSHQQVFVFVSEFLRSLELQQPATRISFLAASLVTVILALIGMETIMYEFFSDSSITFHVIIMVWAADQFDSLAIQSQITRRHFLRFFYLYQFVFYAYHYRFNGQYSGLALLTTMLFTYHSMIYFFHHFELPLLRATYLQQQQQQQQQQQRHYQVPVQQQQIFVSSSSSSMTDHNNGEQQQQQPNSQSSATNDQETMTIDLSGDEQQQSNHSEHGSNGQIETINDDDDNISINQTNGNQQQEREKSTLTLNQAAITTDTTIISNQIDEDSSSTTGTIDE
ncbi:membralin-like protein [Dermatophagoides farinae]|uniref:Membralin-like protein n=1 Tax=Dermatophagoides farinae TaxID=6954 RepID=A0A9D4NUF1_DERFA|nr:membralin-like protein [Dermatophagoides farinae]